MVLKSPVKISTAVLGHKEKFLGVIGLLAGRIQRLFISFSLKKKKKTCNYCILTPKQAITSQKLSPGNQTLAWLIRLTSLANHSYHCAHGSLGPGWLPLGPGLCSRAGWRWHRTASCCVFLLLTFMCSLKLSPLSQRQALFKKKGRPTNWSPLLHKEEEAGKKKKERKATEVVNSFQHRKSFFAL